MSGQKLSAAFQEIEFSDNFEDRVKDSLENGKRVRRQYRRALVMASCFLALFLTTGLVTAKYLGGLEKIFGSNVTTYEEYLHKDAVSAVGEHFKLNIKEYVCTKNEICVIVGVEALTDKGKNLLKLEHTYVEGRFCEENAFSGVHGSKSGRDDSLATKDDEACYVFRFQTPNDFTVCEGKDTLTFQLTSVLENLDVTIKLDHFIEAQEIVLEQASDEEQSVIYQKIILSPMSIQLDFVCKADDIVYEDFPNPSIVFVTDGEKEELLYGRLAFETGKDKTDYAVLGAGGMQISGEDIETAIVTPDIEQEVVYCLNKFIDMKKLDAVIVNGVTYEIAN